MVTVHAERQGPARLRARDGFALEATLMILVVFGALILAAAGGVAWATRTTTVDYQATKANYAVEAGAEHVMGQLESYTADGFLDDAELAALTTPTLTGYTWETLSAARVGGSYTQPVDNGTYAGLFSLNQRVDIRLRVRDVNNNRSEAVVGVIAQAIPIFQFGVFYEKDLEIHPGANMVFEGWVHSNGRLYLNSGATLQFRSNITTPDSLLRGRKNQFETLGGVSIADAGGTLTALTFDNRSDNAASFRTKSENDFDSRVKSIAHGVNELRLPLPSGMPARELIRPRNYSGSDNAQAQATKYAWRADWHITIPMASGDISITDSQVCDAARNIRAGGTGQTGLALGTALPNTTDCDLIFNVRNNRFLDPRDDRNVDLLEIDMRRLRLWINGSVNNRRSEIMYIAFTGVSGTAAPRIRLINADTLHGRFSIATDVPVYVWGGYNSAQGFWVPASIAADAVTFISDCWVDANHTTVNLWDAGASGCAQSGGVAYRDSAYVAIAAGHSPTPCDYQHGGCGGGGGGFYSGGLENFPRFVERWGGNRSKFYRGSLVSLFDSESGAYGGSSGVCCQWNWRGNIYGAPARDWAFDTRFFDPANMPPGTPVVGSVFQIAYRPVF